MRAGPKFTLAIETATQKGSLSLLREGQEIAFWTGDGGKAVSAELLPRISELLSSNDLSLNNIDLLAVSAGPGSFTGVRIGLSVAQGLQMASGSSAVAVPLPEALARSAETDKTVICLIPSGRNEAYWQEFHGQKAITEVTSGKIDEIAAAISEKDVYCLAAPGLKPEYIHQIEDKTGHKVNIAGDNLAKYIGLAGIDRFTEGTSSDGDNRRALTPMYVKSFNAGR